MVPVFITFVLSVILWQNPRFCSTRRMLVLLSVYYNLLKNSTRISRIAGASPSEGSSIMINLGWVINARAMASICCEMFFGGENAEKSGKPEGHIGIDVRGWCL